MRIRVNTYNWTFVQRAVFMFGDGEGCVIAEDYKQFPFIYNLNVVDEMRGQGIARRLLYAAEEWLKGLGYDECYLNWDSHDSPQWVLDWYIRCGYKKIDKDEDEQGMFVTLCKEL